MRFERPHAADLVQPDADARAGFVVETEVGQRLAHVEISFAAGHDAEARMRRIDFDAVEFVRSHVGEARVPLVVEQTRFLHERRIGPADVQPTVGHHEVFRQDDVGAVRIDIDRCGRFDHVGHALHRDPEARVAAHRPAVQAEVQIFLHVRRKQHRKPACLEDVFGLMRECRGFGGVIVAGEHENAAVPRRAGRVAVLEDVTGPVDAGALAVPHRKHAVVFGARVQIDLLRTPHGGGREVFVDAGLEHHLMRGQMLFRFPQRLVEPAERRSAVAGDEAGRVEAGGAVAFLLQHRQTHQRLDAAHVRAAAIEGVFVVERDGRQRGFERGSLTCV
ncbi:hypothetical protein OKW39_002709 [Paraburkholderia sp. MM6662-R1]